MAFNLQTFKTRFLSSVYFVIVMLAGLLINQWTFFVLFSIIHFGCWVEYQKLIRLINPNYQHINSFHKYGIMFLGWGFMLFNTNEAYNIGNYNLPQIGVWIIIITSIIIIFSEISFIKKFNLKNIGYSVFGLIYISLSWALMMNLRSNGMYIKDSFLLMDLGWATPLFLIITIWINDTMAYIVGSFFGKTSLSKISPKKTLEGTVGGALLAIVVVSLIGYYLFDMNDIISLVVISSIAVTAGTFGDLFESKLKRMAHVKDSGNIIPGHGGFLDRFDSLLLATPFVWLYVKFFL